MDDTPRRRRRDRGRRHHAQGHRAGEVHGRAPRHLHVEGAARAWRSTALGCSAGRRARAASGRQRRRRGRGRGGRAAVSSRSRSRGRSGRRAPSNAARYRRSAAEPAALGRRGPGRPGEGRSSERGRAARGSRERRRGRGGSIIGRPEGSAGRHAEPAAHEGCGAADASDAGPRLIRGELGREPRGPAGRARIVSFGSRPRSARGRRSAARRLGRRRRADRADALAAGRAAPASAGAGAGASGGAGAAGAASRPGRGSEAEARAQAG